MARPKPKIKALTWCGTILLTFAIAAPVMAFSMPEVPGFSNNYPWFNEVPQDRGSRSFQWFLANHPNIAETLARHPGLLYNADWRSQVPALEQYLEDHPYEWQELNEDDWAEGPAETQWETTMISINGRMPIGGIGMTPTGSTTIIRIGTRSTPAGSVKTAPMTRSITGTMANGGTTRTPIG
jgi:hypothetical protein